MSRRWLAFGAAGLIGAGLTGLGEGLLQLQAGGDYTDPAYGYFVAIPEARQSLGHWLAVLAAPLYLAGYWHLTRNLAPQRPRLATGLFAMMAYAFMLATVWLGQRVMLALASKSIAAGEAQPALIEAMAAHNEPLVNALRVAILVFSLAWVWLILTGASRYPRWVAVFNPFLILAAIFGLYFVAPGAMSLVLPTAMNTTHVIVFAVSLLALAHQRAQGPQA